MANIYVRSTDGSNSDNGSTWALAKLDLVGAAGIDAAGDVIWVSQAHAESTAGAISPAWAGSQSNPTRIICGDDSAAPPTALATTATVTTTGNSNISLASDRYCYVYGITFVAGSGASGTASILLAASSGTPLYSEFEECSFQLASTGTSSVINSNNSNQHTIRLRDCTFKFAATAQKISNSSSGKLIITGGSVLPGSSAITEFVNPGFASETYIDGVDLSNCAAAMNVSTSSQPNSRLVIRNCKMPASWSGSVHSGTPAVGALYELFNCSDGDVNYRYERKDQWGTITHQASTLVRTGGATDGTTPLSWKMVSNTTPEWKHQTLDSNEIVVWNETVGSAITVTLEFLHDSATNMTDREIWMEAQYLGTSGVPLSSFIDDAATGYLTTAADQADSSETWDTTGMSNPNTQKMSVTFTPQEKGFIVVKAKLAATSKTVYVCPKLTIS